MNIFCIDARSEFVLCAIPYYPNTQDRPWGCDPISGSINAEPLPESNFIHAYPHYVNFTVIIDFEAKSFDVIHSSNLIDPGHVEVSNLVLKVYDVLKADGFLFASLLCLPVNVSLSEYMEDHFGVSFDGMPILFNMRCIGCGGPFDDGISPRPTSKLHELSSSSGSQNVNLVWQKVVGTPIKIAHLDPYVYTSLVSVTVKCLQSPDLYHLASNAVGACKALQTFVAQIAEEDETWKSPGFWREYCNLLKKEKVFGLDLWELQTMMLMHGLHIHLTVTDRECPICRGMEIAEFVGSFKVRVGCGSHDECSPAYKIFVYESQFHMTEGIVIEESLPPGSQRIRCLKGESGKDYTEFLFFFPRKFAGPGFRFLVCDVTYQEYSSGQLSVHEEQWAENFICGKGFMSEILTSGKA